MLRTLVSSLALLCAVTTACSGAPNDSTETGNDALIGPPTDFEWHVGAVISNVRVVAIYWSNRVRNQARLDAFYEDIVQSPYMEFLKQYRIPGQTIGHGTFWGSRIWNDSRTSITDDDVQSAIADMINTGQVPLPDDGNELLNSQIGDFDPHTLYVVHLPQNVTLTAGKDSSCGTFDGYHAGTAFAYAVIADCDRDKNSTGEYGQTAAASHELIEAITDPHTQPNYLGASTQKFAWFSNQAASELGGDQGEIGDICDGMNANNGMFVDEFWVDRGFDKAHRNCYPTTTLCTAPRTACGESCPNLQDSNTNCGACGNVCPGNDVCQQGTCVPTVTCGTTSCPGGSVNYYCSPKAANTCCNVNGPPSAACPLL